VAGTPTTIALAPPPPGQGDSRCRKNRSSDELPRAASTAAARSSSSWVLAAAMGR